jgi:hypothetical protein
MLKDYTSILKNTTPQDLYEISLKSSNCKDKEIFIFEKGDMNDLMDTQKVELIRQNFLKNKIKIKQITNSTLLKKFTDDINFLNNLMLFRYIPEEIFSIENEILIFDNTVAIYNSKKMLIIEDESFVKNQKQLFMSIWEQGNSPKLNFEYTPNHSFYKNMNLFITIKEKKIQIVVWPDVDAKKSYTDMNEKKLENYFSKIITSDSYYDDTSYIIAFIWTLEGDKMIDIWKFTANSVDDRSGPLGDVRVYKNGKICKNIGISSGNTLLVLGYEEKIRRQAKDLKDYLEGEPPKLPLEIVNGQKFFKNI